MVTATKRPVAPVSEIPLDELYLSELNPRQAPAPDGVEALAASILAQGVLVPLIVHGQHLERYGVADGGRRLVALQRLAERGAIPGDQLIPCLIVSPEEAATDALVANTLREQLQPWEEFQAFARLHELGQDVAEIAAAFGVASRYVLQRLRLAAAAPDLLEQHKEGRITLAQLEALCSTDDHDRQRRAWANRGWTPSAHHLRELVTDAAIDASRDDRVRIIGGVEAYQAAGGEVEEDLFTEEGGGFLRDASLLDQLVAKRLEAEAEKLRAEGWSWVEIWPSWQYTTFYGFGRSQPKVEATPEQEWRMGELRELLASVTQQLAGIDGLEDDPDEELSDEEIELLEQRRDQYEGLIQQLEEQTRHYSERQMKKAGAIVALFQGTIRIERGLIRKKPAQPEKAKPGAAAEEPAGPQFSQKVVDSLLGYRNAAAALDLAHKPRIAKALLALWVIERHQGESFGVPLDLRIEFHGYGTRRRGRLGVDEETAGEPAELLERGQDVIEGVPRVDGEEWDGEAVFAWLLDEPDHRLDDIIAYGVARALSLSAEHDGLTAQLLEAMRFDMAEHYTAGRSDFWDHLQKRQLLSVIEEIDGERKRQEVEGLKTDALREACATSYAYCPPLIETPGAPWIDAGPWRVLGETEESAKTAKPAGKKKAAKKKRRNNKA